MDWCAKRVRCSLRNTLRFSSHVAERSCGEHTSGRCRADRNAAAISLPISSAGKRAFLLRVRCRPRTSPRKAILQLGRASPNVLESCGHGLRALGKPRRIVANVPAGTFSSVDRSFVFSQEAFVKVARCLFRTKTSSPVRTFLSLRSLRRTEAFLQEHLVYHPSMRTA